MRGGRVVQLWFFVIHRPGTRGFGYTISLFTRDTHDAHSYRKRWIVHRLPSPNDLPAPRRERGPTWPLLNATLDRAVYTYLRVSVLPLHQPLFLPISRPDGRKKAKERERGRREEDLYAQWQPVIPVAATGSALLVYFVESLVAKESIHEKWW